MNKQLHADANMKVARNLNRTRKESKLDLVATTLGLGFKSHSHLLHMECGERRVQASTVLLAAKFFNVDISEFFKEV